MFHPIGLILATNKPVIIADPYTCTVQRDELVDIKEQILKRRYTAIGLAKNCSTFGILLSTKPGQQQKIKAIECKDFLRQHKKQVYSIIINHITPSALENFPQIDCFISTACPRIVIDDAPNYNTLMITPVELKIAFGVLPLKTYQFDEITNYK